MIRPVLGQIYFLGVLYDPASFGERPAARLEVGK
jgi:hypothetical protein